MNINKINPNPNNPRFIKDMKKVDGFTGYFVTKSGKLYSNKKGSLKEIIGSPDKDGYLKITLTRDDKKPIYKRKHRIIAEVFIKNDLNKPEVNHINGDKTDNCVENLEWVTLRENQCHRRKTDVGVCWDKKSKKYRAYIQHLNKWYHLGFFSDKNEAKQAYISKVKELGVSLKYAV